MDLIKEQSRFTEDVVKLVNYLSQHGYLVTFGEVWRSPETAEIYAQKGKGIKNSLHCTRLAVDLNLFSPQGKYLTDTKDYEFAGNYWESLDNLNRWGGNFVKLGGKIDDKDHFERHI